VALRFCDGFDHYAVGDVLAKWTSLATGPASMQTGRFGSGQAMRFTALNRQVTKVIDSQATWIVGFAYRSQGFNANQGIIVFIDGAVTHCDLRVDAGGHLFFTRNGTTIGSVGTTVLNTNTWYYLEVKVTISDAAGVAVAKINGVTELNGSSLDTRNAGNATADTVRINSTGGSSVAETTDFDDLYVCDASGSTNNDFLGDVRVEALFPNGNGNSSVLVGSDGNSTDNYLLVDETTPATADYVESSTVGDKDTYAYTNPTSTSGSVFGVQVLPYAAKTDAGARSIVSVARLSGTEVDGAAKTLPASGSPGYLPDIRETKPGGGSWSISDVSNAEFGVKINA
jgi:hypothetical protein